MYTLYLISLSELKRVLLSGLASNAATTAVQVDQEYDYRSLEFS